MLLCICYIYTVNTNRPIRKLAYRDEFEGDPEALDTAAYINVREDSSTGSTYKLPLEVEFPNRSNRVLFKTDIVNVFMKNLDKKKNSHRQEKVATLIHESLIDVLRRGRMLDAKLIDCPITITKVTVTPDLKTAHCYFVPFNTNLKTDELSSALNNSKYAIRNFITTKINMKFSPEIRFHYDHGFDNATQVEQLLQQTKNINN